MQQSASIHYDREKQLLTLAGDWSLAHYRALSKALMKLPPATEVNNLDAHSVTALDFNTASLLTDYLGDELMAKFNNASNGFSPAQQAILRSLVEAVSVQQNPPINPSPRWYNAFAQLGAWISYQGLQFVLLLNFIGEVIATAIFVLLRPARWRWTAWFFHMQQAGLAAIPIVSLMAFLVGAVVAFLGATVLTEFGATIYTVDLVAFGFMRELGVLLAAILLAGRTASSFTAQIGAMKVNEELDAMRIEQLNPIELLVIPRLLALLVMLPLLGFVSIIGGLVGGAAVAITMLDISLTQYLNILNEVPIRNFWVGISKAPFFAVMIAIIGCLEGFKVDNNARSIGEHTTSSVVQALFAVILLDAIAALFFMEMQW